MFDESVLMIYLPLESGESDLIERPGKRRIYIYRISKIEWTDRQTDVFDERTGDRAGDWKDEMSVGQSC